MGQCGWSESKTPFRRFLQLVVSLSIHLSDSRSHPGVAGNLMGKRKRCEGRTYLEDGGSCGVPDGSWKSVEALRQEGQGRARKAGILLFGCTL